VELQTVLVLGGVCAILATELLNEII
jgi:hypothetical protein